MLGFEKVINSGITKVEIEEIKQELFGIRIEV